MGLKSRESAGAKIGRIPAGADARKKSGAKKIYRLIKKQTCASLLENTHREGPDVP
jgi:hypothetical protein